MAPCRYVAEMAGSPSETSVQGAWKVDTIGPTRVSAVRRGTFTPEPLGLSPVLSVCFCHPVGERHDISRCFHGQPPIGLGCPPGGCSGDSRIRTAKKSVPICRPDRSIHGLGKP